MKRRLFWSVLPFLAALLGGCASGSNRAPDKGWIDTELPHSLSEVLRVTDAVLTQKFGYKVKDYEEREDGGAANFSSEWNYRDAHGHIFSGSAVRRQVWVDIEEQYDDYTPETALSDADIKRARERAADPKNLLERERRLRMVKGQPKLVSVRLSLVVRAERNESIVNPGKPELGEWKAEGEDSDEMAEIIGLIQERLREISRRPIDLSPETEAAHLRYLKEDVLSDAERDRLFRKLREGQDPAAEREPDGERR